DANPRLHAALATKKRTVTRLEQSLGAVYSARSCNQAFPDENALIRTLSYRRDVTMKTTKDTDSTVSEPRTIAPHIDEPLPVPALPAALAACNEQYMYFTERDIDRILENLDGLRERVFPKLHGEDGLDARHAQHFPSVCLIGLGRCGSNIALDVASLVYNARRFYLNEFSHQERPAEQRPAGW